MKNATRLQLILMLACATAAGAQTVGAPAPEAPPTPESLARLRTVARSALDSALLAEDAERRTAFARHAESTAAAVLTGNPADLDARYVYAAAIGLRASRAGLRDKVHLGNIVYAEANSILELDPGHPGAHLLLGSINAVVMRMNAVTRFVVQRLLGSDPTRDASWERAESHFRAILEREPDSIAAHYELGRLLMETGREEEARAHIARVLSAAGDDAMTIYYRERAEARWASET